MIRDRVPPKILEQALADLRAGFGDRIVVNADILVQHANTLSEVPNQPPDAVLFARSTADVATAVGICARHRLPVIPFGAGTSLEGHVNAPSGGLSIDTSGMTCVIAINPDDMDCIVEAGVTREALNHDLRASGLFFPVDPASHATLGGMVATRASGTNAVRYGTMQDVVLSLTAVLASGEIVSTGTRARKSSAGYDLTRLLVGSEGTLGVVTEIGLRLAGIPESILAGIASFPSVEAACRTVIETIQMGIPVARIELLDELQVRACNAYSRLALPETPLLFLEFHGTPNGVAEQAELFGALASGHSGEVLQTAASTEARETLWTARKNAYWAARGLRPGTKGISTDVCVPISALAVCVEESKADAASCGLVAPIVGHVGDGNFHIMPLIDYTDTREVEIGLGFVDRLVRRALRLGGTTSGEHGIGQSNKQYLAQEFGDTTIAAMRAIKMALDPMGIMNPGKIFD